MMIEILTAAQFNFEITSKNIFSRQNLSGNCFLLVFSAILFKMSSLFSHFCPFPPELLEQTPITPQVAH